jgi:hypothetical protein
VLAEELAIWAMVGVALLLVAAIIWRGEAMPKVETSAQENRPDYRDIQVGNAHFEERAWLAMNRYGHDRDGQSIGPPSQASAEVGAATERALPLLKVEAPAEGSLEGASEAASPMRQDEPVGEHAGRRDRPHQPGWLGLASAIARWPAARAKRKRS